MLVAVWRKKTCFIQFALKIRALNFRSVFFWLTQYIYEFKNSRKADPHRLTLNIFDK